MKFAAFGRACLFVALCAGSRCFADSVISPSTPADTSISMLEEEAELFGLDPADAYSFAAQSQLWTSDSNALLYSNLLDLITTLGGDQAMIDQLFQPGAVFAGDSLPGGAGALLVSDSQPVSVPEPATMGLLGGTLLFLSGYALFRTGRIRACARLTGSHGPIRAAD